MNTIEEKNLYELLEEINLYFEKSIVWLWETYPRNGVKTYGLSLKYKGSKEQIVFAEEFSYDQMKDIICFLHYLGMRESGLPIPKLEVTYPLQV